MSASTLKTLLLKADCSKFLLQRQGMLGSVSDLLCCDAGQSRATAGPGETFLWGPQTFSQGSSGEKIFEFFSKWYILAYFINFWPTAGAPKSRGAWGSQLTPNPPS